ncbi:MAG: Holliday junction branch migration protein RuvA [Myxococcota bacterium]
MIARLEGVLRHLNPTRIIVDVGGVGYVINIPLSTFTELPDEGKTIVLQIHTHSRDGSITLYGFLTGCELAAFELLLFANRVGPRLAQTILSGIEPASLLHAIQTGDVKVLRSAPGVGTKLAERMLVELRDRTGELAVALAATGNAPPELDAGPSTTALDLALSALLNLGYSKPQADRALIGAVDQEGDDATLENLVRGSLRMLAK